MASAFEKKVRECIEKILTRATISCTVRIMDANVWDTKLHALFLEIFSEILAEPSAENTANNELPAAA